MSASVSQGYDVCGSNVVRKFQINLFAETKIRQFEKNSFTENYGFSHPSFITNQSRLESFYANNWPRSMSQTPEALAEAGFFYKGDNKNELKKIKIKYLLISQEWHLIVNVNHNSKRRKT
jgi:hypothetical protein